MGDASAYGAPDAVEAIRMSIIRAKARQERCDRVVAPTEVGCDLLTEKLSALLSIEVVSLKKSAYKHPAPNRMPHQADWSEFRSR
jgi:hypothetical protein